jgi:hypothetical protein
MRCSAHKQVEDLRDVAFNGQFVKPHRIQGVQLRRVKANERFVRKPMTASDV